MVVAKNPIYDMFAEGNGRLKSLQLLLFYDVFVRARLFESVPYSNCDWKYYGSCNETLFILFEDRTCYDGYA